MAGIESIAGHMLVPSRITAESAVWDLGANQGEFYIATHRRFGCRCFAVEPAPGLFERLPDVPGLQKYNIAVSSETRPRTLALSENSQANSFSVRLAASYGLRTQITVPGVSLRDLFLEAGCDQIDVMKVDIEGAEIEMFESSDDETLLRCAQIAVEFHDFLLSGDRPRTSSVLRRMQRIGFMVLVFSSHDRRQVLLLNRRRMNFSLGEQLTLLRLRGLIHLRRSRARLSRALHGRLES